MSAPEEYVVRTDKPGSVHLAAGFMSEDAAREFASGYTMGTNWTYSVHLLGPAIEPPEPREWVVVSDEGWAAGMGQLKTREEAERVYDRSRSDFSDLKIVRVVEDGAS